MQHSMHAQMLTLLVLFRHPPQAAGPIVGQSREGCMLERGRNGLTVVALAHAPLTGG